MMHFVQKDTISIADIVEKVVAELHGENAIAEIDNVRTAKEGTTFEMDGITYNQRTRYLVRAGEEISELEDAERWDGAAETIRLALSEGEITAYVTTKQNSEKIIPKAYWAEAIPASLSILKGILAMPPEQDFADCSVYVQISELNKWLVLPNPEMIDDTKTKALGRPISNNYAEFEQTLLRNMKRLGGDWTLGKSNAEIAMQTQIWMLKIPNVTEAEVPGDRAAKEWISIMRKEQRIP